MNNNNNLFSNFVKKYHIFKYMTFLLFCFNIDESDIILLEIIVDYNTTVLCKL